MLDVVPAVTALSRISNKIENELILPALPALMEALEQFKNKACLQCIASVPTNPESVQPIIQGIPTLLTMMKAKAS